MTAIAQTDNGGLQYTVRRTERRRSLKISVSRAGIEVVCPRNTSDRSVRDVIRKNEKRIREKHAYFLNALKTLVPKEIVSGEAFTYLGRHVRLKVVRNASPPSSCELVGKRLQLRLERGCEPERGMAEILNWYRLRAADVLNERVLKYQQAVGVAPRRVVIKNVVRRWGSASSRGLNFNWRLVMMPHSVIDYVVVHELCHLRYSRHSAQFWSRVRTIVPDCDEKRRWLREHSLQYLHCFGPNQG